MYVLVFANMRHFFLEDGKTHYANIILYEIDHTKHSRQELLHQFANAVEGIRTLQKLGMPYDHCSYLEQIFFKSLPPYIHAWLLSLSRNLFQNIRFSLSSSIWNPDYIWKTGPNKGRTTLQLMKDKWEEHHENM